MLYCCETCGKKYNTEEKALECERVHEEEKARQKELAENGEVNTMNGEQTFTSQADNFNLG